MQTAINARTPDMFIRMTDTLDEKYEALMDRGMVREARQVRKAIESLDKAAVGVERRYEKESAKSKRKTLRARTRKNDTPKSVGAASPNQEATSGAPSGETVQVEKRKRGRPRTKK